MASEKGESSNSVTLEHALEEEESNPKKMKITSGEEEEKEKEVFIKLKTSDEVIFDVEASIVKEMKTLQSCIDDTATDSSVAIPLLNVTSRNLRHIITLKHDEALVEKLSFDERQEVLVAADYLNMRSMIDFLAQNMARCIKNESVEFVRAFFKVINDYSPEEEAECRKENEWAFQNIHIDDP